MFRRLLIEDSAAWFTITAFVTALSIYLAFTWRALRMKRQQVQYFEYLPFEAETPAAEAETKSVSVALRGSAGTFVGRKAPIPALPRRATSHADRPTS